MDALDLLLTRESAHRLVEPGPSPEALELMLKSAVRAPDHGRLRPWRLVVIEGQSRERLGELLGACLKRREPNVAPEVLAREAQKALRAPMIVVVAARIATESKIPAIEQVLAAGAAAQNIMLAAHALGYGAMWRTGAPAYDDEVKRGIGLEPGDSIVGFLYIGTRGPGTFSPARPEPKQFVTYWRP